MAVTTLPDTLAKVCLKCGAEKPITAFHLTKLGIHGRHPHCADCRNRINRERYASNESEHRTRSRNRQYKHRYGLTVEEYAAFFAQVDNMCEICGTDQNLCVDHDHNTGDLRGVLCKNCNNAIGLLQENPEIIKQAMAYLERSR